MNPDPDDIQWPAELPLPACGDAIDPRLLGKCVVVATSHFRSPDGEAIFKHVKVRFYLPINTGGEKP